MTNRQQDKVALVCHAIVAHRFAMMCNPKFRGVNFSWDDFPADMGEVCESELFLHMESPTDKMKAHARETGEELADSLVRRMTE